MSYRSELNEARKRLEKLRADREALDVKIAEAKRRVAALAVLSGNNREKEETLGLQNAGLGDACRTALQSSKRPLTIMGLRSVLESLNFPVDKYKSPLASIQTTITRMVDTGEVEPVKLPPPDDRRWGYRWVPERQRAQSNRSS